MGMISVRTVLSVLLSSVLLSGVLAAIVSSLPGRKTDP